MDLWEVHSEEEKEELYYYFDRVESLGDSVDIHGDGETGSRGNERMMLLSGSVFGGLLGLSISALGQFAWNNPSAVLGGLGISGTFFGIAALIGGWHAINILAYNRALEDLASLKACPNPEKILAGKIGFKNKRKLLSKKKSLNLKQQHIEQGK